ncbi:hydrogenase [Fervidicella metallireducens AeB]|uniref:Hydrogenase n=1 Tax=Fervidicella metallireducens AeB TaxID=1403537 RepID=A0A017RV78_9CLOT|nr:NADH-quinone oxidoreductase subunit H [Fervidicella metallireducens]EYE88673.1 hydrogenase [Fervidicella metallireducens AeB]
MIINIIQSMILIIAAPLFSGILKRIKAILRGYEGAPVLQPYFDIKKLLSKERVISKSSSFITTVGPIIILSAAILSAFLTPVFFTAGNELIGNMFILIFILSIIKFFNTLIGLDCACTFGGMGSSREMFIYMFAEPVVFLILAFVYFETKSFNIYKIAKLNAVRTDISSAHIVAAIAFLIWLIAENARMPVDNPETHLELTMVHEAMILDISGRDLAYIELASAIKLAIFLTIFINIFLPFGMAVSLSAAALIKAVILYLIKMLVFLLIIAIVEISIAKFRLFRVPELIAASFSFAIAAISMMYFS